MHGSVAVQDRFLLRAVLQLFQALAQQLLAPLEHPLLIRLELAAGRADLHGFAHGHVPECIELAEVAALLGGLILQQFAAEAAVTGAISAFA